MRELDTIFFEYILSLSGVIVFSAYTLLTVGTTGWLILGVSVVFLSLIYINARNCAVVNGAKSEGRARTRAITIMLVLIILLVAGTVSGMTWVLTKWPIEITDPVPDAGGDGSGNGSHNVSLTVTATWEAVNASSTHLDAPILRITMEAINTTADTGIGFGNLEPALHNGSTFIANLTYLIVDTNSDDRFDPGESIRLELGQYGLNALEQEDRAAYRILIRCRASGTDTNDHGCEPGSELATVPLPPLDGTGA